MYRCSETVNTFDVDEAYRIIQEAILVFALDPMSGKIDMDIINTGQSNFLRRTVDQAKQQLPSIFSADGPALTKKDLAEQLKRALRVPIIIETLDI